MSKGKRKHVAKSHKTLNELKSGETIRTYIPFEENTPDYFNGHHPDTIRPQPYRNRFGQAGKERLVVYIGKDSYNNMLYLPITSSHASRYDSIRHYEVKDKNPSIRETYMIILMLKQHHYEPYQPPKRSSSRWRVNSLMRIIITPCTE